MPESEIFDDMRSYSYWKDRRDEIVRKAIRIGVNTSQISLHMGVDKKFVAKIRKELESEASQS